MLTTIAQLRKKPRHVRQRIAFLTALGLTVVIFLFWVAAASINTGAVSADDNAVAISPWTGLTASVGDAFSSFIGIFKGTSYSASSTGNIIVVPPPGATPATTAGAMNSMNSDINSTQ